MQNFTLDDCDTYLTPTGKDYVLVAQAMIDERDNKTYQVRKFADGKCWMVDNLAYGGLSGDPLAEPNQEYCAGKGPGDNFLNYDSAPNPYWCSELDLQGAACSTTKQLYGDCIDPRFTVINDYCDTHHCGYWYSWQGMNQDPQAYQSYYQPPEPVTGICPAGWHVPIGGASGEFVALYQAIGYQDTETIEAPETAFFNFNGNWREQYAGNWRISDIGMNSVYWSSSLADVDGYYSAYISNLYLERYNKDLC
jgi:uncharacterized protein (TIGR02145 family)